MAKQTEKPKTVTKRVGYVLMTPAGRFVGKGYVGQKHTGNWRSYHDLTSLPASGYYETKKHAETVARRVLTSIFAAGEKITSLRVVGVKLQASIFDEGDLVTRGRIDVIQLAADTELLADALTAIRDATSDE
jgi:hypothetical protein